MINKCTSSQYNLVKRRKGKQKSERQYLDVVCAFDIEATNLKEIEQAVMYIWQFQMGDKTIVGRTWEEFLDMLERLGDGMEDGVYMVVYIHNASYEFSFLKGVYAFSSDEVFAMDRRDVVKFEMFNHFEFRCSYHLTNMSLDKFLKEMQVPNKKTILDYTKRRFSWTELTEEEMEYCVNDVKGLVQAIEKKMRMDGDTLHTIPLTSTGYVRRSVKASMIKWNHNQLRELMPTYEVYLLLREAFRGGNTHGSRFYTSEILHDVKSYDRVSSYPDVMINKKFPMKEFIKERNPTMDRLITLRKRGYAYIMRVVLTNVKLKDRYEGCPYLSRDKVRFPKNGVYDNGRILSADFLETCFTDVDWLIFIRQYSCDECIIKELYSAKYGYLPEPIRNCIRKYYSMKTTLKGCESEEDQYMYGVYKALLNATYGMMVQDPLRDEVVFDDETGFTIAEYDPRERYEKSIKKAFLSYAWGCWVTCYARAELQEMMDIVKQQGAEFVYCDTDSVKFFGDVDFTEYNRVHEEESRKNGGIAKDRNGVEHALGVLELDGCYDRFKHMGAKKYAYEDKKGLHITIAGVNKKEGAKELAENGGLEAMQEGFTFVKAGGTEAKYNDLPYGIYHAPEGDVDITPNLFIKESAYTLGLTDEYIQILLDAKQLKYCEMNLAGLYEKKL